MALHLKADPDQSLYVISRDDVGVFSRYIIIIVYGVSPLSLICIANHEVL